MKYQWELPAAPAAAIAVTTARPYTRAFLAYRVSSDEQADDGFSLDAQRRELHQFCQAYGIEIVDEVTEDGVSGFSTTLEERPALRRVLELAEAGRIDVFITHKVDRLARNLLVALSVISTLRRQGVAYYSAAERIDFSTPIGEIIFTILAGFAQYFSRNLAAEVRKGKLERVRQGSSNGRPPLGYHYRAAQTKRGRTFHSVWQRPACACPAQDDWTACAETAPVIVELFERYARGSATIVGLTTDLNQRQALGRRWNRAVIRYILHNPVYTGVVFDAKEGQIYPGQHPALIDASLYHRVQEVALLHSLRPRGVGATGRVYLLQGVIRCHACGNNLRARTDGRLRLDGSRSQATYYAEYNRLHRGLDCPAPQTQILGAIPEAQVRDLLTALPLRADIKEHAALSARAADSLAGQRRQLLARRARLRDLYEMGELDRETYHQRLAAVLAALETTDAAAAPSPLNAALPALETLTSRWDGADPITVRDLIRYLFVDIFFDIGDRRITSFRVRPGLDPWFALVPRFVADRDDPTRFTLDPPLAAGPAYKSLSGVKPAGPALSVQADGSCYLNQPLWEALGTPAAVTLTVAADALWLAPATVSHTQALPLSRQSRSAPGRRFRFTQSHPMRPLLAALPRRMTGAILAEGAVGFPLTP